MKFLPVFLLGLLMNMASYAQAGWKVCLDSKILLSTTEENEDKNVVRISTADLKTTKELVVSYTEKNKKNKWNRFISLYDENDHELVKQPVTKFKISTATLASYFEKSGKIKIYTWALPTDPKLKAAIRVRRVHLCTLIVE